MTRHLRVGTGGKRKLTSALAVVGMAGAGVVCVSVPAHAATVDRIGGTDRMDTAIQIYEKNRDAFTSSGVVLARSDVYADALAATPQAARLRAPILTNPSGHLDSRVLAALKRQGVKNVGIVGGTAAISPAVEQALRNAGMTVARLAGSNRYDTALTMANDSLAIRKRSSTKVYLATGTNFADALAAGPAAAKEDAVILLSMGSTVDAATSAFLKSSKTTGVVAVGGPAVAAARAAGISATAVSGTDRYDTAAKLAARVNTSPTQALLASGQVFADALPGGALAALRNAPLLLTQKVLLSAQTSAYLAQHKPNVLILGGPLAISTAVASAVTQVLGAPSEAARQYASARTTASSAKDVKVSGWLTMLGYRTTVKAEQVGGTHHYQHFVLESDMKGTKVGAEAITLDGQMYVKADAALWLQAGLSLAKANEVAGKWAWGSPQQVAHLTKLTTEQLTVGGLISGRLLPAVGPLGASVASGTVTSTGTGKVINAAKGASVTSNAAAQPVKVVGPTNDPGDVTLEYVAATKVALPTTTIGWPI